MSKKESTGSALIKAVTPILHDLARPASREIGGTVAEAVHWALSPIHLVSWSFEQAAHYARDRVSEVLEKRRVPKDHIRPPAPEVAGQVIHMLRFPNISERVRDLYVNLLATSIDSYGKAHPCFVEIIRQLSPAEARLIPFLRTNEEEHMESRPIIRVDLVGRKDRDVLRAATSLMLLPELTRDDDEARAAEKFDDPSFGPPAALVESEPIDHLVRLGLADTSYEFQLESLDYASLENHFYVKWLMRGFETEYPHRNVHIERGFFVATSLGVEFARACTSSGEG